MFKLQNKVELIVPQEDNNGQEISSQEIKDAVNTITKLAGGCTITEVKGQWYSDDEQRIMEDNNLNLEWYYNKDMAHSASMVNALYLITWHLIEFYNQEAISIKINGVLYIIDGNDLINLPNSLHDLMFKN